MKKGSALVNMPDLNWYHITVEKKNYLEHKGEEDIPILVVYKRLPYLCFCCRLIGYPYKECDKYKGQPMNKLAYGAWMQANEIMREGRRANVTKIYPSSYQKDTHVAVI